MIPADKNRELLMFLNQRTLLVCVIPLGDDVVTMKELHVSKFIQRYASQWDQLASLLDLENYHIANISRDNSKVSEDCCKAALKQWLKMCPSPTWGKLEGVVKIISSDNGNQGSYDYIYTLYNP